MSVDLTGGLNDDREYVFATQPADPEMRESVNIWAWDNGTEFGMPRIGIEAVADQWETHDIQVNIAFADGRVFNLMGNGEVHDPLGADGRPRTLGAGPLSFELLDPFRHWRARFDGEANQTSIQAQIDGWTPGTRRGDRVAVELELDIRSAAPPWESGTLLEEAGRVLATQEEGDLMGGPRFEQLFPRPDICASATRSTTSTAAVSGSDAAAFVGSPRSVATSGSRRSFPAAALSACAFTRIAPTASRPSTRATSSRAAAGSSRRA